MNCTQNILVLSLFLLLIGSAQPALSDASATTEKTNLVLFMPNTDWPPYVIDDPKHPDNGVMMKMLKAVAEPLGYSVTFMQLTDKRGWNLLENGGVDVYASAREWVGQPDKFLWTDPFLLNEDVLLYRADSPLRYTTPKTLYGRRVAAISGFTYPALEAHFGPEKITRVDTASPRIMLELLSLGRVDAALVNRTETEWMFRNHPEIQPERFRLDEKPFDSAWYRFVFPKGRGWEPVINKINDRLKAMKKDGSLKAILEQYR